VRHLLSLVHREEASITTYGISPRSLPSVRGYPSARRLKNAFGSLIRLGSEVYHQGCDVVGAKGLIARRERGLPVIKSQIQRVYYLDHLCWPNRGLRTPALSCYAKPVFPLRIRTVMAVPALGAMTLAKIPYCVSPASMSADTQCLANARQKQTFLPSMARLLVKPIRPALYVE
jgi:hypothetical protein